MSVSQQQSITKQEYERAFNEFAAFLLAQYKKKKQEDLTNEPNLDAGQVDNNVT